MLWTALIVYLVLNPAIRLTWIQKHWDREYIDGAETTIRQTVSLSTWLDGLLSSARAHRIPYKMIEYREREIVTAPEEEQSIPPTVPGTREMPAYMSLAVQYGITDDDMDIGHFSAQEQTIEQEFQSYITAPLSPKNIDIIKFWEVSTGANFIYISY
jgi:hypothetical protein